MLVIFVLLQIGDFLTTYFAIEKGGVESNPFVKKVIDKFGYGGLAVVKLLPIVTVLGVNQFMAIPVALLFVFNIFYTYIVINNLNVIRSMH